MGHLQIKGNKCGYKVKDKGLKEQFTNNINDDDMVAEIIRELMATKVTKEVISAQVLAWATKM